MNNDLISRSALLEKRFAMHSNFLGKVSVVAVKDVEDAPAVDAEKVFEQMGLVKEAFDMAKSNLAPVVRCKDCYYWMKAKVNRNGGLVCPKSGMEITATDYCSKAEKRKCHYDR